MISLVDSEFGPKAETLCGHSAHCVATIFLYIFPLFFFFFSPMLAHPFPLHFVTHLPAHSIPLLFLVRVEFFCNVLNTPWPHLSERGEREKLWSGCPAGRLCW